MPAVCAVTYSKAMPGSERPGHGAIYRSVIPPQNPMPPDPSNPEHPLVGLAIPHCESVYHSFQQSAMTHSDRPCLGAQPIVNDTVQPFEWLTYTQVAARVEHLASGMMHFELLPVVDRTRMLGLYMKNSIDWVIAEQAGYAFNCTTIALYDTLGADSAEYILNQTELPTIVCTTLELPKLIALRPKCPHLQNVIISGSCDDQAESEAKAVGLRVLTIAELETEGKKNPQTPQPPKESDVATIMYTSGTTGDPKGVVINHAALLASSQAALDFITHFAIALDHESIYFSYLPLAHIFERTTQIHILRVGARIGFYCGNPLKLLDDLKALHPTVFACVPRLLNRIYDMMLAKMRMAPKVPRMLFFVALQAKLRNLSKMGKIHHALWDKVVFSKTAASLGLDRARIIFSGSAPLSPDVLSFWRVVFPALFVEGYGQTETCAGISATHITDLSGGYVGGVSTCAEIKLESVPDMNYHVTDREHGDDRTPCVGRGEICVRGTSVFSGYFKQPEKTAETIDADGWLHTGDIGLWSPQGSLRIIDRKKNIFKLSQGEYVAPEKIEIILQACATVAQIFVTGDSFHSHLVAIIVPDELVLRHLAPKLGFSATSTLQELCDQPTVKEIVRKQLEEESTKARLGGFERIKQFYLHHELFSVENDLLTPTFKLRRTDAERYFKKHVEKLYELSGDVIAGKNITQ